VFFWILAFSTVWSPPKQGAVEGKNAKNPKNTKNDLFSKTLKFSFFCLLQPPVLAGSRGCGSEFWSFSNSTLYRPLFSGAPEGVLFELFRGTL